MRHPSTLAANGGHMEFQVLGKLEVRRDGDPVDLGEVPAACAAGAAADLAEPRALDGSDHRRALGRRSGQRPAERPVGVRVRAAQGVGTGSEGAVRRHGVVDPVAGIPPARPNRARSTRCASNSWSRRADRSSDIDPAAATVVLGEALALWRRPRLRGVHLRVVRAGRDRPSRGVAARGGRGPHRGRPRVRAIARAGLGAGDARPTAPARGGADRSVDACAVPIRAPG